jgi:uncharacterized membrane protein YcaP (DUF421 family)
MWTPQISPLEVAVRAFIIYLFVQLIFRLAGRKEFNRYSPFNLVLLFLIAVALRTSIVGNDSSITSAMVALGTMVGMDWIFSYLSYRNDLAANLIEGCVHPLIENGKLNERQMRKARVSRSLLLSEVRLRGGLSLDEVDQAMMEHNGQISVHFKSASKSASPSDKQAGNAAGPVDDRLDNIA